MNVQVLTGPAKLPVTVEEMKEKHPWVDTDADDTTIEQKIRAVVASLDPPNGRLGRCMITQTLRLSLRSYPPRVIKLPFPPVQSVAAVKYVSSLEVETLFAASNYVLIKDREPALLVLVSTTEWPTDLSETDPLPIKVEFVSGYGDDPANIPEDIRLGIMMEVADFYLLRENLVLGQSIAYNEFTRRIFDNYIWRHVD